MYNASCQICQSMPDEFRTLSSCYVPIPGSKHVGCFTNNTWYLQHTRSINKSELPIHRIVLSNIHCIPDSKSVWCPSNNTKLFITRDSALNQRKLQKHHQKLLTPNLQPAHVSRFTPSINMDPTRRPPATSKNLAGPSSHRSSSNGASSGRSLIRQYVPDHGRPESGRLSARRPGPHPYRRASALSSARSQFLPSIHSRSSRSRTPRHHETSSTFKPLPMSLKVDLMGADTASKVTSPGKMSALFGRMQAGKGRDVENLIKGLLEGYPERYFLYGGLFGDFEFHVWSWVGLDIAPCRFEI